MTPAQSARVLRNFYAEMGRQPTRPQPSTQQTQSAADANQQRLRASAGIPSRGSGRPSGIATDDFTGPSRQASSGRQRKPTDHLR